jgi:hypothetical protein
LAAAQEPESSREDTDTAGEHQAEGEDRGESESRQHSRNQEPDPGKREYTTANALLSD